MGRIFFVEILGAVLILASIWQLGLLDTDSDPGAAAREEEEAVEITTLGDDLYKAEGFPEIKQPTRVVTDPIILYGVMNALEPEEVPSQVAGRILFIGEQVDEGAVPVVRGAAFPADPFYLATFYAGEKSVKVYYRRLSEGQEVKRGQMVALIEPAKAMGEVRAKAAKVEYAMAEYEAAKAGEEEGLDRFQRAINLFNRKAIAKEELGAAQLTWKKLESERITKEKSIKIAQVDKEQADIDLRLHEIRPVMPYERSFIKSIVRQRGYAVKPGDPVLIVQNLDRLQAEALIEEQSYRALKEKERAVDGKKQITATIEPTILEKPLREWGAHDKDVTSLAVSRDMKIVSAGGEDKSACVWSQDQHGPLSKLKHADSVVVVACTPAAAGKNLCLAGCANGDIYVWDLDAKASKPFKRIEKAHGDIASITSLAFSPNAEFFASGASNGSIRLWSALDGAEKYAFIPKNGVKQCHENAVTSLHFTKQCKLISAGNDKTLQVWQLKKKGAAPDREAFPHRGGGVPQLGVSPDGKWMLFDQGRTLKLYSVETGRLTHTLSLPVSSTPFEKLALFSPDSTLILTAGGPECRLQLWRAPEGDTRAFEVRQFATSERQPVTCAAFSPAAGKGGPNSFAVSASGKNICKWFIPTEKEVSKHRITKRQMTLRTHSLDPSTKQSRVGFEVANPGGLFEAGRPATIVIDE
jgi:WD40 repeat protein